jgi:hypothetical protein
MGLRATFFGFFVGFAGEPELAEEGDLRAAGGVGASNRPAPDVGDGGLAADGGIEGCELPSGALQHPFAPALHLACQLLPVALGILDGGLQDEIRHRVVFQGVGFGAQAQGFQGDGAAAGEGIQHLRGLAAEALTDEPSRLLQQVAPAGVAVVHLPPTQVGDELLVHLGGFGEQGAQHSGAGHHQRSPRPPDVEGGDVAVADSLLPAGFLRQDLNRQHLLDEVPLVHELTTCVLCARYRTLSFRNEFTETVG